MSIKVNVKDVLPNPFRRIQEYQIIPEKVEALINSIEETFFWENLIARPSPDSKGKHEIAYGHHRMAAIRKLGMKEIELNVKPLTDVQMLKIMADENAEDYAMSPAVLNETILAVKCYLDNMLKTTIWQTSAPLMQGLLGSQRAFETAKGQGVGREIIKRFLGKNWSMRKVEQALAQIHADEENRFDRKAAEKLPTIAAANRFLQTTASYKLPKEKQAALVDKLVKEKQTSSGEIFRAVRKEALPKKIPKGPGSNKDFRFLKQRVEGIGKLMSALTTRIFGFNAQAREMGYDPEKGFRIDGLQNLFSTYQVKELMDRLKDYLEFFGYNFKTVQYPENKPTKQLKAKE